MLHVWRVNAFCSKTPNPKTAPETASLVCECVCSFITFTIRVCWYRCERVKVHIIRSKTTAKALFKCIPWWHSGGPRIPTKTIHHLVCRTSVLLFREMCRNMTCLLSQGALKSASNPSTDLYFCNCYADRLAEQRAYKLSTGTCCQYVLRRRFWHVTEQRQLSQRCKVCNKKQSLIPAGGNAAYASNTNPTDRHTDGRMQTPSRVVNSRSHAYTLHELCLISNSSRGEYWQLVLFIAYSSYYIFSAAAIMLPMLRNTLGAIICRVFLRNVSRRDIITREP